MENPGNVPIRMITDSLKVLVRGGTGTETKFFMDGNLVNNYFGNSVPGIKAMDRLNISLFKGNVFSSGGYTLFVDLDGVLVDFAKGYEELTGLDTRSEYINGDNEFWAGRFLLPLYVFLLKKKVRRMSRVVHLD